VRCCGGGGGGGGGALARIALESARVVGGAAEEVGVVVVEGLRVGVAALAAGAEEVEADEGAWRAEEAYHTSIQDILVYVMLIWGKPIYDIIHIYNTRRAEDEGADVGEGGLGCEALVVDLEEGGGVL
jgi:hypothetical protein